MPTGTRSLARRRSTAVLLSLALAGSGAVYLSSTATAAPNDPLIYAIGDGVDDPTSLTQTQELVSFRSSSPTSLTRTEITGGAMGDVLVGLDVRPLDGRLYAIGRNAGTPPLVAASSRLYVIDVTRNGAGAITAATATQVTRPTGTGTATTGETSVPLDGTSFGLDINPDTDRIRVTSNTGQSLSIDPDTGIATASPPIAATSQVTGVGYTNNVVDTTANTLLYGIDAATDMLVRIDPASSAVTPIGLLNTGGNVQPSTGLDIQPALGTAGEIAFANLQVAVTSGTPATTTTTRQLYRINLASGAATLANNTVSNVLPADIEGLTVATPRVSIATASSVSESAGNAPVVITRSGDVTDPATITVDIDTATGTAAAGTGAATQDVDFTRVRQVVSFVAGQSTATVNVPIRNDSLFEGAENFTVTISNQTSAVLLGRATTTVTITDDDNVAYVLDPGTIGNPQDPNRIGTFSVPPAGNTANIVSAPVTVTGPPTGTRLVGIDVRPNASPAGVTPARPAETLYAVGVLASTTGGAQTSALYTINPTTGVATTVGPIVPALVGAEFGVDFNPVADRLRIVSDTDQNLRVNPDTGAAVVDTPITPAAAVVGAVAYDNSFTGQGAAGQVVNGEPTGTTTLYDIETTSDFLTVQEPNSGVLTNVGTAGLGIDATSVAGFDIAAFGDQAFAVLRTTAANTAPILYAIDLTTGIATSRGAFATTGIEDIAFRSTSNGTAPTSATPTPSATATTPAPTATTAAPTATATGTIRPSDFNSPPPSAVAGRFVPVTPSRIFDSRAAGSGGAITGGADRPVMVNGRGGIPMTGVSAVVANVTVTGSSVRGDLQVYPTGNQPTARTSNLNYAKGQTVAVAVEVGVSPTGQISLSANSGTVQVIVDVFGYYTDATPTTAAGTGYTPLAPRRVLDTRTTGGAVVANADRTVQLAGTNGVPADATAVVVNATALGSPMNADVQFFPVGNRPAIRTSNLNIVRGQTVANAVTVPVGTGGNVAISVGQGQVQIVLDVLGYYSPSGTGRFTAVQPARILDTRTGRVPVVAGADRAQAVRGNGGVPAGATAAVLSVTATGARASTDLQVFPTGAQPMQRTSSLNLRPGQAVANLVIATIGTDGSITLSNSSQSVDVIIDVLGYLQ